MRRPTGAAGQPLPEAVVSALIRVGLSRSTVLAMERWKAQEVLDLLHSAQAGGRGEPIAPTSPLARPVLGFSTQD